MRSEQHLIQSARPIYIMHQKMGDARAGVCSAMSSQGANLRGGETATSGGRDGVWERRCKRANAGEAGEISTTQMFCSACDACSRCAPAGSLRSIQPALPTVALT